MSTESAAYHRQREQECREAAQTASNAEVKRRHEELAKLHAGAAERDSEIHLDRTG